MHIKGISALVTGGASGLGRATAERLAAAGARVTIADLPGSPGAAVAQDIGFRTKFVSADVLNSEQMDAALDIAIRENGPLRVLVHCAGRGGALRVLEKDGKPSTLETFTAITTLNLTGTFNVLRLSAARMASAELNGEERGVAILTASIAAYEGQVGQIAYAASKAGIVGMTLVAARDLAGRGIRVCSIAPGIFETPLLARVPEEARASLSRSIPFPSRLGRPDEFAMMATQIIENPMLNGETIRLDGALRMAPR